jgi:hypothetical protein
VLRASTSSGFALLSDEADFLLRRCAVLMFCLFGTPIFRGNSTVSARRMLSILSRREFTGAIWPFSLQSFEMGS